MRHLNKKGGRLRIGIEQQPMKRRSRILGIFFIHISAISKKLARNPYPIGSCLPATHTERKDAAIRKRICDIWVTGIERGKFLIGSAVRGRRNIDNWNWHKLPLIHTWDFY